MSEQQANQSSKRALVPLWVALAGLLVAFICGAIILANALEPLYHLVFPTVAEAPLPADAVELDRVSDPILSDEEVLYGTDLSGCEVAEFYMANESRCRISPLACDVPDGVAEMVEPESPDTPDEAIPVAICEGTHQEMLSSYSWQVIINSGYADYNTKFRVYLYTERD